jgi:hypothetical protein
LHVAYVPPRQVFAVTPSGYWDIYLFREICGAYPPALNKLMP